MHKLALLPLLLFAFPALAAASPSYDLKHPKREHCRAHYTKKVETVKEHKRHRTVKVRKIACIYVAPKKALLTTPAIPATAPVSPIPARAVKLHAHLDPSFTRDPSDPFKVTYAYSASATSELVSNDDAALSVQPAPLPEGVLTLYSNGSLACAVNVGGETTGGECPVTYPALGAQTITTIYTSGSTSATETSTENVEPFSTTTTGTVTYEALQKPEEISDKQCDGICYRVGILHVDATATGPYGELAAPQEGSCASLEDCLRGTIVYAEQQQTGPPSYEPYIAAVTTAFGGDSLPAETLWGEPPWYPPGDFAEGRVFMRFLGGLASGYASSEARLPVTLTVTAPL